MQLYMSFLTVFHFLMSDGTVCGISFVTGSEIEVSIHQLTQQQTPRRAEFATPPSADPSTDSLLSITLLSSLHILKHGKN